MVILTPLFCGLGLWQLDRAEQKRAQAAALEIRRKLPPLSLNDTALPEKDELPFRQVVAKGHYLKDRTILIENRKHLGQTGYHVITPLQLSHINHTVLVNRGWIAYDRVAEHKGIIQEEDSVTLGGEITIPMAPAIELATNSEATMAPPRWPYLTLERYAAWSGLEILPFMVLQTSADGHGLVRQWPNPRVSDMMHIGYAIQWFAFALITLLVWLRLSLHKAEKTGEKV